MLDIAFPNASGHDSPCAVTTDERLAQQAKCRPENDFLMIGIDGRGTAATTVPPIRFRPRMNRSRSCPGIASAGCSSPWRRPARPATAVSRQTPSIFPRNSRKSRASPKFW